MIPASGEGPSVLAVDVGGTFTDVVRWDGAGLDIVKESSTPDDQSTGVVAGAARTAGADRLLHGTTVATNALLQRRGARCALVTTAGLTDIIEIGRQDRPSLYDAAADRPAPLVDRELRFEAPDDPSTWVPPAAMGEADAVAVSLLYGFERPEAEAAVVRAVEAAFPGRPVVGSSEVVPEFREYERTATTVLNAYLAPETAGYLRRLVDRCREAGLPEDVLVMRSSGGLIPIAEAVRLPVAILLSGPAGGVVAAAALGEELGLGRLVSFDMGGTSTDVCRIEGGRPEVAYERSVDGYPCRMPSVAIHTVGAGGGSIAWRDDGGSLRVGPQSAGAAPGPAAYGRGGDQPTVTDADVVLGRIDGAARLGGTLRLQADAATAAVSRLADSIGLDPAATALGVCTVVEDVMAGAIRRVSIEEGADPREATLIAFGGAGGLHATAVARRLGMAGVVVPLHAGVFSALGLLMSPPRIDVIHGVRLDAGSAGRLAAAADAVADEGTRRFAEVIGGRPETVVVRLDARYVGQAHELSIPWRPGDDWESATRRFDAVHLERNGFSRTGDPVEIVTFRSEATGRAAVSGADLPLPVPSGPVSTGRRPVRVATGIVDAEVICRQGLAPGDEVIGPAVVEESDATTFIGPGDRARVHDQGALVVEW